MKKNKSYKRRQEDEEWEKTRLVKECGGGIRWETGRWKYSKYTVLIYKITK